MKKFLGKENIKEILDLVKIELDGKADNLDYNSLSGVFQLKSGDKTLDSCTIEGGGGGGVGIGDVIGASATASSRSVSLTWTDPEDVVLSGVTLAAWGGTLLVRKEGSAPTSKTDGDVVVDSKERNAYASTPYTDSGLENGKVYYYRFFPYTDGKKYTDGTSISAAPERIVLQTPTQGNTLTYTGEEQTPTWSGYVDGSCDVSGEVSGINAGSYSAIFTPTIDYMWSDGTTDGIEIAWSINKASGNVTLSKTSVTLDSSNESATVNVSGATGTVTVKSSNTSIATVSPTTLASDGVITITSPSGASGTATITVSVASDDNHNSTSKTISVTASFAAVYGVEWDGTSTTSWSRTDDAEGFTDPNPYYSGMTTTPGSPFDGIQPWAGMQKSTRTGGVMVSIPKYYYKLTKSGTKMKLQIVPKEYSAYAKSEGYFVSPAHMDRGDGTGERDVIYVGRYHCSSNYKSETGVTPKGNVTRANFRTYIHNLGANIWQWDYATLVTIRMLYLVEFANWNSQEKIGYGCSPSGSIYSTGATDSMPYHTGTDRTSRTIYGATQYRYIEDLWGNVFDWCDGIYFSGANIYYIINPSKFSDSSNGTLVGERPTSSGYISAYDIMSISSNYKFWYVSAVSGSKSTYVCDYCDCNASGVVLRVGGYYSRGQDYGLFYLDGGSAASGSYGFVGSRLLELP
jgi:hypothetical protein